MNLNTTALTTKLESQQFFKKQITDPLSKFGLFRNIIILIPPVEDINRCRRKMSKNNEQIFRVFKR